MSRMSKRVLEYAQIFLPTDFSTYVDRGVGIGVHFGSTSMKVRFIRLPAWLSGRALASHARGQ